MQDLCPQDEADGSTACCKASAQDPRFTADRAKGGVVFHQLIGGAGDAEKDSASFLEFVSTRVSEIKTKSDLDKEWF
jgi:hypothetical protein